MALVPRQGVSVTTAATRLDADPTDAISGDWLQIVAQAAGTLVIGATSAMTAANGCRYPVLAGTVITIPLDQGEQCWGIVASSSLAVDCLLGGA